jgi:hypothetical protein
MKRYGGEFYKRKFKKLLMPHQQRRWEGGGGEGVIQ